MSFYKLKFKEKGQCYEAYSFKIFVNIIYLEVNMNNVICISGDYRAGKSSIAKGLTRTINVDHYSMRKLKNCETTFNANLINWDKLLSENDNDMIDDYILETAKKGNCLLDFRYSTIICSKNNIPYIGIWISASIQSRMDISAHLWKISPEDAFAIINEREIKEESICQKRYKCSYRDKKYYHHFLDLSDYQYPLGLKSELLVDDLAAKLISEGCIPKV